MRTGRNTDFDDELFERIQSIVRPGEEILTLAGKRPNVIASIDRDGIRVKTLRSESRRSGPQLVPAWMIVKAWRHLQKTGVLTNVELLEDLNVKRSAFVIALLAQFTNVIVRSTQPIVIELVGVAGNTPNSDSLARTALEKIRMPLVLAQNEMSAADIVYADKLGVSYEYPARYRSLIKPGEHFVYYRGKRRADGSIQVPHYLGTGVIGEVTAHDGMYRCSIENYQPFESIVPFKIDGQYLEPDANGRTSKEVGLHFRTGVRTLDEKPFAAICNAGLPHHGKKREPPKVKKLKKTPSPGNKASTQLVELATELAIAEAKSRWPSATFFVAPPESHFKLAVRVSKGHRRHIAIKGTTAAEPLLQLTTNEIVYSKAHGESYSIWVFYDLDLEKGTGRFVSHDGPITDEDFDLAAALHGGRMRTREKGKKVGPVSD